MIFNRNPCNECIVKATCSIGEAFCDAFRKYHQRKRIRNHYKEVITIFLILTSELMIVIGGVYYRIKPLL